MKSARIFMGVWLAATIAACSALPALPTIPPGWTLTPSITSTPPVPPTPTITPTLPPVVRIDAGDRALFNGDYANALLLYRSVYEASSDPVLAAAAKWGEARVLFAQELYFESIAALQTLVSSFPDSPHAAQAYFLQGLAQFRVQQYVEAATSWQTYLDLRPGYLDAYTQELRGDAFFLAQDYASALTAYTAAIQAPRRDDGIQVDLKVADTQAKLSDTESAVALYEGIIARPTDDAIKAQAAYEAGLVYQSAGQNEQAFGKYRFVVENYPRSNHAYLSLLKLVEADAEVDDVSRGLVDYYAGQYDVAIAAFDRYISANPGNDGTPHYYRGLALRAIGDHQGAVDAFSFFIDNYPTHPNWVEAWDEKAYTQWFNLGLYTDAAQTLLTFVASIPNSSAAVDFLMMAGRIYERDNRLNEAALTWARVASDYPADEQAATAIFLAGIAQYRQADYNAALSSFDRSLVLAVRPEDRARAYLWTGKTQKQLGDLPAAQNTWQQGVIADPGGYYSDRARDLLTDRPPLAPPATSNLTADLATDRNVADSWVRLTFNLPAETDLTGPGTVAQDPRFIRGTELWQLGLFDEARLEFEDLRQAINDNPVDTYRLGNYLLDLGLYRTAIFSLRRTLEIAGLDTQTESMMAPPYFSHVRYGLYYADLIVPYAQAEGFDPLLLFSIIRQESFFEGFVRSSAGARGLMQIIPSTGGNIASQLNWPLDYSEEDLYRPDVNLRFGTHYLADSRDLLGGDLYGALAAYNGGPGNAVIWKQLAGDDPDLFLEVVRFEETRNYIRNIYELYVIYRRLYSPIGQ